MLPAEILSPKERTFTSTWLQEQTYKLYAEYNYITTTTLQLPTGFTDIKQQLMQLHNMKQSLNE